MPLPLKEPFDLAPELALVWPTRADVRVVDLEELVDALSMFPADERRWAAGKKTIVAEAELFAGTLDQKMISWRSRPITEATPEVYRETLSKLEIDVRHALEAWRNELTK